MYVHNITTYDTWIQIYYLISIDTCHSNFRKSEKLDVQVYFLSRLYCVKKELNTMDENFLFLYSSFYLLLISFIVHSSMVDIFSINATTYLHFCGLRIHIITQWSRQIMIFNLIYFLILFHRRKCPEQTETFWTRMNYFHKNHRLHVFIWVFCVFYFTTIFIYLSNENIGLFILTSFFILK